MTQVYSTNDRSVQANGVRMRRQAAPSLPAIGERMVVRVRGVRRASDVLDLFSVERPYWGPTEVAAEVGVAKSSAYELLRELARSGLLERMACGQYRLGWRLVGLARTMLQSQGHNTTLIPAAQALASQLGETVHLAALDRDRVLYAASVVPAGGVAAPTAPVGADMTPLGQVLNGGHSGVLVGPQRAIDGVTCAATVVHLGDDPAGSIGVCATNERFAARGEVYARAVGTTHERLARAVRL